MSARLSIGHAYFHEALSGRFHADVESLGRARSVAHLLMIAYEHGEVYSPNSHRESRTYDLSEPPVTVALHISHWDIHCLTLAAAERQMDFIHTLEDKNRRSIQVVDNATVVLEQPLGLEYGIETAKFQIGEMAEDFFRSVAAARPREY